jgi:two-component system CheB/CheR fusion protein
MDELALFTPSLGTYAPISRVVPRLPTGAENTPDVRAAQNEANRAILDRYGPPAVVINEDLNIIQFRGHTGPYLEPAPGDASLNLLKLAREGLIHGLRSALQTARKSRKPVRKDGVRVRSNGSWTSLDLEVIPLTGMPNLHYLVVFDEAKSHAGAAAPEDRTPRSSAKERKDGRRAERLEEELAATREYLQSIIQEVEAANEELQSANEEILSSNEELQSTNEELDTAKEELQSTNEELNTLNEELHARNEELTRVNSDLVNLLASVQIAIVIVSTDLRIRRFTPMAEKLLNLIPADIGRPLTQLRPNLDIPDLGNLVLSVVDKVEPVERDVQDNEGRWFSLRIRPYKGVENRIEGAVVAIFDVDNVRRHEAEVARLRAYADGIMDTVAQPLVVLYSSLRVLRVNASFSAMFGVSKPEAEGRVIYEVRDGTWNAGGLRDLLEGVREGSGKSKLDRAVVVMGERDFLLTARSLDGVGGERQIVLALEEATGRHV